MDWYREKKYIWSNRMHLLSQLRFNETRRNTSEISRYVRVGADKSLARPTSRCILVDDENISYDASLVIYIYIVIIFLQFWL